MISNPSSSSCSLYDLASYNHSNVFLSLLSFHLLTIDRITIIFTKKCTSNKINTCLFKKKEEKEEEEKQVNLKGWKWNKKSCRSKKEQKSIMMKKEKKKTRRRTSTTTTTTIKMATITTTTTSTHLKRKNKKNFLKTKRYQRKAAKDVKRKNKRWMYVS